GPSHVRGAPRRGAPKPAAAPFRKSPPQRCGGAPGVVAMGTARTGNIYEGAAGKRELGKDEPMATDSVFAIFSTTKALTGTCIMQLVEEGKIRLEDAAKRYGPEVADLQGLGGVAAAGAPPTRGPRPATP